MTKSVSLSTRLKIAASLKGNKNAYKGGPKKKLTAREKVANINARKNSANLSTEQRLRREKVAKRLRAEARKEESLGGGVSNSTPHAGVANKTPAMKTADKLATGNIPKLKDQTATKASPSLPAAPMKTHHPNLSNKDNAELAHAAARVSQIDNRLAEIDREQAARAKFRRDVAPVLAKIAKPTTTERIKAANAKSKAAQEPRPRDERTVTGNGQKRTPDSQLSSEALAKAAIFEAKPDRNRPGVPFKKPVAKPTQNSSGVDNKQAAANAVTKATSPGPMSDGQKLRALQRSDLEKEIRGMEASRSRAGVSGGRAVWTARIERATERLKKFSD